MAPAAAPFRRLACKNMDGSTNKSRFTSPPGRRSIWLRRFPVQTLQTQWLPKFFNASRRYLQLPLLVLAAATLAGCSEKPQILVPQDELVLESQHRSAEQRERTLNQGESDRMSY
jgi:hypothetical protein